MQILSFDECREIVQEFDAYENKLDESNEGFYRNSFGVGNLATTIKHEKKITEQIRKKYPDAVFANSYTREYRRGSYLKIHTDRIGLDLTMSVCLEKSTPAAWPLHVSRALYDGNVWDFKTDPAPFKVAYDSYDMAPGVGVMCEGRKNPHWRDDLECGDDERAVYVFYHWTLLKKPLEEPKPATTTTPSIFIESPSLALYEGFLTEAECALLIYMASERLTRSTVVDSVNGGSYVDNNRTSHGMCFTLGENPLIKKIEERISKETGLPVENGEGIQILRYRVGQEYKPHFDYFDPAYKGVAEHIANNRVATFLMYLNTPKKGGATIFPDAGIQVAAKQGNGLLFAYATPTKDTKTLHGGMPVEEGEKWIATKWIRGSKY